MGWNKNEWLEYYKKRILNEERFKEYMAIYKPYYNTVLKYAKPPAKLLEVGCGGARLAICLSTFGFKVTAAELDAKVLEIARMNGRNFGKDICFMQADAFKIDENFKPNSFDACTHHGVIEHFEKKQIVELLEKQLKLADYIIFGLPILSESNIKQFEGDGIYRNLWSIDKWVNDILESFNVVEYYQVRHKSDDMVCVIRRIEKA